MFFLDLTPETFGWLLAMLLANGLIWWRALTHQGDVEFAEMALISIIFILGLLTAACFWFQLRPSELAVCLTAQIFGIGTMAMSPAIGLRALRYHRSW